MRSPSGYAALGANAAAYYSQKQKRDAVYFRENIIALMTCRVNKPFIRSLFVLGIVLFVSPFVFTVLVLSGVEWAQSFVIALCGEIGPDSHIERYICLFWAVFSASIPVNTYVAPYLEAIRLQSEDKEPKRRWRLGVVFRGEENEFYDFAEHDEVCKRLSDDDILLIEKPSEVGQCNRKLPPYETKTVRRWSIISAVLLLLVFVSIFAEKLG